MKKPYRRFTPEEDKIIIAQRIAGQSHYAIARTVKRSRSSIKSRLNTLAQYDDYDSESLDRPRE